MIDRARASFQSNFTKDKIQRTSQTLKEINIADAKNGDTCPNKSQLVLVSPLIG